MTQTILNLVCLFFGHALRKTGLQGCRMTEYRCDTCARCFVTHDREPFSMIDSDDELRELMRETWRKP